MKKLNSKVEQLLLKVHTNHTNIMDDEDENRELHTLKNIQKVIEMHILLSKPTKKASRIIFSMPFCRHSEHYHHYNGNALLSEKCFAN